MQKILTIFQESVTFQENEGKYGGALMLDRSVAVLRGDVSFVRNHAQESGGAVYARDSQIIINVGQNSHLWRMKNTMVELWPWLVTLPCT